MRRDDEGVDWLADWRAIRVDADSVRQLASDLQSEVYENLRPHTERLFEGYGAGVAFGARNPGGDLHAVRSRYHDCLAATVDQLAAYINVSSVLLDAVIEISTRYQSADALAAASVQDIGAILSDSIVVAGGPVYGYVAGQDNRAGGM
jgi:hypothetical protein